MSIPGPFILCVEDHPSHALVLLTLLRSRFGASNVWHAFTVGDALKLLRDRPYVGLLSDWHLEHPDTAYEVIQRFRELNPHSVCVVYSSDSDVAELARRAGADEFVHKSSAGARTASKRFAAAVEARQAAPPR